MLNKMNGCGDTPTLGRPESTAAWLFNAKPHRINCIELMDSPCMEKMARSNEIIQLCLNKLLKEVADSVMAGVVDSLTHRYWVWSSVSTSYPYLRPHDIYLNSL